MIKLKTTDYALVFDIRLSVVDLTAVEQEERAKAMREEAVKIQQKRLAGIEEARKKRSVEGTDHK